MDVTTEKLTTARTLQNFDALKGILILFVVLDHNDVVRSLLPDLFKPLTFHVLGFLLLPFLIPSRRISWTFFRDRAIRYMVPYWWVLTLTAILFFALFNHDQSASTALIDWLAAFFIGSAPLVKDSSGFFYLWFLPCLTGIVITLAIYETLAPALRVVWMLLCTLVHLFISFIEPSIHTYAPFGLVIVMWVFPIGIIFRWLFQSDIVFRLRFALIVCFFLSYGYLSLNRISLEIMTLDLSAVSQPVVFLLQDISAVLGVLTAAWFAGTIFHRIEWLKTCGKHSLLIYLFHPLVFMFINKAASLLHLPSDTEIVVIYTLVSVIITVITSLFISKAIGKFAATRRWITPRDWATLTSTR